MKWLIAFCLVVSVISGVAAAQELSTATIANSSPSSSSNFLSGYAAFPVAQAAPREVLSEHDSTTQDTWELSMGYGLVRFTSSQFNATMSGLNTTASYFVRNHVAVEGSVTAAFGFPSASSATAKFLFYGAGAKVNLSNFRTVQPFVHALIGGVHVYPQTAFSNKSFAVQMGGGAEKRLWPNTWVRMEGDYLRSQLYSSSQNNFQLVIGVDYRF
jgi:opacity protein-like surface antigen